MSDKYEKASETELKIISTTERVVTLSDLKQIVKNAQSNIERTDNEIAEFIIRQNNEKAKFQEQLDDAEKRVREAEKLGVKEN